MNEEEIEKAINEIKVSDDEVAHILEDELYLNFVTSIANDNLNPASELAKKVLTTKEIKFCRWCA